MLRVLHITSWYPNELNPAEGTFIRDRIESLAPLCHQDVVHLHLKKTQRPFIWKHRQEQHFEQSILESRWIPWRILEQVAGQWLIQAWHKRRHEKFDLVNVHVAYPLLVQADTIRREIPVPVIVSEHWSAYHYRFHLHREHPAHHRINGMWNCCDGMIAVSDALAQDVRAYSGARKIPYKVVPNGVDGSVFFPGSKRKGEITLAAVNGWSGIKQPRILLDAVREVTQKYTAVNLRVIGDGPLLAEMRTYAAQIGLSQVVFTGALPPEEVAREMRAATLLICSSAYETFHRPSAESLMCGTPVVSTPIPAIREYLDSGSGIVSNDHSASSLAAAISEAIERWHRGDYDSGRIAARASALFERRVTATSYLQALQEFAGKK